VFCHGVSGRRTPVVGATVDVWQADATDSMTCSTPNGRR
jgi:hypothetical protein